MSLILRCQRGFTTVTVMGVLATGSLLVAGGFAAVNPEIGLSRNDQDYKQAYAAAEAGVQWYLTNLARDNIYYTRCTNVLDPNDTEQAPVNNVWNGSGSDPRLWRNLTGSTEAQYTVELLPAPGYSACDLSDQYSMVDSNGNMRLRVSGRSRTQTRSIIVTLRRRNFIDYIWFTHFETQSPLAYASASLRDWAKNACTKFRQQRSGCEEIQFATDDVLAGPVHSNDSILVCGTPTFGRDQKDLIELNGRTPGYVEACSGDPDFQGTRVYPAGQLEIPGSNAALLSRTAPEYLFKGRTRIVFNGNSMTVTKPNGSQQTKALPANGVIYVQNGGACTLAYARTQIYDTPSACGDAWVQGSYSRDLTIAADNDVIIDGNLMRTDDTKLLGLIANNFVRIYHPVNRSGGGCQNAAGSLVNPEIHAAILALNQSFITDNWYCGSNLGKLTIDGAIAQYHRGTVGTAAGNGYIKAYSYNKRLKFREPPYFLDPVLAAWRVARQNEQVPATK